jgi:hypothetical protein
MPETPTPTLANNSDAAFLDDAPVAQEAKTAPQAVSEN